MKLWGGPSRASALPLSMPMWTAVILALQSIPLLGASVGGASLSDGKAAETSVGQIRDTLHNLLRSIDDAGRDAETLFGKRQLWCDQTIQSFEAQAHEREVNLANLQAGLTEDEAAVEEAQGTVRQVKVDVEMVKHTIKQTEDMMQVAAAAPGAASLAQVGGSQAEASVLNSLIENKRLSLDSLDGELEVAVPVLAQLEAGVAETKQRLSYRSESLAAGKDFLAALRDGCSAGAERADSQAAARIGESNSINVALQALDAISKEVGADTSALAFKEMAAPVSEPAVPQAASTEEQSQTDGEDSDSGEVSFVQLGSSAKAEVTTEELESLFDPVDLPSSPTSVVKHASSREQPLRQVQAPVTSAATAMRPRVQALLAQIRQSVPSSDEDQTQWCAKQREDSALALKLAKDSVAQLASQLDAHLDAEAELGEDLEKLQTTAKVLNQVVSSVSDEAQKEQALIKSNKKDQQLATKILDQAITILSDLGLSNVTKAVNGLNSAKKMLLAQISAADGFEQEASTKATSVAQLATQFTHTQESEEHTLELAKDDHSAERLKGVETKRLYEADVEEAALYMKRLSESCKAVAEDQAVGQRAAQIHALEDADKALQGKLVEPKQATQAKLRGVDQKPSSQNLTPMQRAAAEMGVSLD